jgi:hypothetical protein
MNYVTETHKHTHTYTPFLHLFIAQVDRILDLGFKMRATRALRQPLLVDGVLAVVRRCAGLPEEDDDAYRQHIASGKHIHQLCHRCRLNISVVMWMLALRTSPQFHSGQVHGSPCRRARRQRRPARCEAHARRTAHTCSAFRCRWPSCRRGSCCDAS